MLVLNESINTNSIVNKTRFYALLLFYLSIIIITLIIQNAYFAFFMFAFALFWDRRLLISILLITPLLETLFIAYQGVTVTKLLVPFFSFLFITDCFSFKRAEFDKRFLALFLFALITLLGTLNGFLTGEYTSFADLINKNIFSEFILDALLKIIFALIIYLYFKSRGIDFLYQNLFIGRYSFSLALIVICIYFILSGYSKGFFLGTTVRFSLEGADPNYFSGMLVSLLAFPLSLCLTASSSKKSIFLGLTCTFFVVFSVLITLSRGGFLSVCFLFFVSFFIYYRNNKGKVVFFALFLTSGIVFIMLLGLIDITPIYERFLGSDIVNLSSLTSERSDLFRVGLAASIEKIFLGYGGTQLASQWINFRCLGSLKVMHNLYLEILLQYGIIGLLCFFSIILIALWGFIALKKTRMNREIKACFFIPFISLASLLFSSLALSWQWREILWYFIGLTFAISFFSTEKITAKK